MTGSIDGNTDWGRSLEGADVVVHLAARVHVMDETVEDPPAEYRKVNVDGTRRLAESAVGAGVKKFVYVSSAKVNGEASHGRSLAEQDETRPSGAYAVSKWEAEQALRAIEKESGMPVTVVRPPLVYGPGVKANFLRLAEAVWKGIPLPVGAIGNARSLVGLDNLVDMLAVCVENPAAEGQTFFVSDGRDVSTPELVRLIAGGLGRKARLLYVPECVMRSAGALTGKREQVRRLWDSFALSIQKAKNVLGWAPGFSVEEEMTRFGKWFRESRR